MPFSAIFMVQPLSLASLDKAGLRHPASAALCLRLAGRGPNSDSLLPPLAAVVVVAPNRGASGEEGGLPDKDETFRNAKASPR